jgi:hypothetical protein
MHMLVSDCVSEQLAGPRLPALIASRYLPIRVIGRGGMGIVYEVEHTRTGDRLALKVLSAAVDPSTDALERFKREARASARIKSEHVIRVTDADVAPELDGAPFLVMELLEGMDLEEAASTLRPNPATAVDWLRQVARAIDKAHRLGIIHRDLKPENLFLATFEDRSPIVKVLDFGIAKMAQEGTAATGSGQVLGTPRYMAPEQAAGGARVTGATDLYAIGLIAYRLIMGESYYRDDNVMSVLGLLLHGQLQPPSARNPSFGAAFDRWFEKACHREPDGRFASAAIQVEALAEALKLPTQPIETSREPLASGGSPPVDGTPTLGLGPVVPRVSTQPLMFSTTRAAGPRTRAVALAVVVAAVVAGAALFLRRGPRAEGPGDPGRAVIMRPTPVHAAPAHATPALDPPPAAIAAPPPPAQSEAPVPPAVPGVVRAAGKRTRTMPQVPDIAKGTKPQTSDDPDPFRDQK